MSPRKSKWKTFTYEELMNRRIPSKPFFINIDEYEKYMEIESTVQIIGKP